MEKHRLVQVNPEVEFWGGTVMIVESVDDITGTVEVYSRIPGKALEIGKVQLSREQYVPVENFAEFMPSEVVTAEEAEQLEEHDPNAEVDEQVGDDED